MEGIKEAMNYPRNTCSWGIGLAETFRNTSRSLFSRPGDKGIGTNLQNPSGNICQLYIPDDGKVFIQADCAGAEALIVAYLCPPGNFRNLFLAGIKPHTYVAMHLFETAWEDELNVDLRPYLSADILNLKKLPRWKELNDEIKKDKENRYYIGKKACHSFNYRKHFSSFIFDVLKESEGRVVLSKEEGERIFNIYHALFPEIETVWHKQLEEQIRATKTLFNLFGHPKEFYGAITDKLLREATAWTPQSTVGTITNIAFCETQEYIEDSLLDWDLLNNKHDSLLLQVPISEVHQSVTFLRKTLGQTLTSPSGEVFQMKTEVSVGKNWGKYSESNPEGMKELET